MAQLLFDENLSPRLVHRLKETYPGSRHVRDLDLVGQSDDAIWSRAQADGFAVVTKDDDFRQMSFLRGAPPKVIWLVVQNANTEQVAGLLERRKNVVAAFLASPNESLLLLRDQANL